MAQRGRFNRSRPGLLPGMGRGRARLGRAHGLLAEEGSSGQIVTNIMPTTEHTATVILLHVRVVVCLTRELMLMIL
jgi:hypothetical protein